MGDTATAGDASAAAPPPVTRTDSAAITLSPTNPEYAYPRGHLGHLSEREERALAEFKKVLEERGILKPGPPASHDDPLLLRFLRARRWVVEDAYTQLKETEDWRAATDINTLYRTIDTEAYENCRRLYPQWTGRRDRRGIPLYVFEVQPLDSKTIAAYDKANTKNTTFSDAKSDGKTPANLLRLFALYENLTRFNMPFCTQLTDREHVDVPITMSTNIVDISGVGLKQFWNLKAHMQAASQLATAHYPETLDRIFVIGAPVFFSTVWGWVKRWFDPITVSKIFILSPAEVRPTLESFIELRDIPKKYGGELEFRFGDAPNPDPNWNGVVEWAPGHNTFPLGPLLWEDVESGDKIACFSLGKEGGRQRKELVCTVPKTHNTTSDVAREKVLNGAAPEVADTATSGEDLEKLKIADDIKASDATTTAIPAAPQAAA